MSKQVHFVVESGPFKGREVEVPAEGVRIGRSSRNDISIDDPALSRFHCRLFLKPGAVLWISDLGSANGTLVNGAEIQERELRAGDLVTIGDTSFRIQEGQKAGVDRESGVNGGGGDSGFNLGFGRKDSIQGGHSMRRWLIIALCGMALVTILTRLPWGRWLEGLNRPEAAEAVVQPVVKLPAFEVSFERVEGTASNIFRFSMGVADNRLLVQVDDLATDRHVRREKKVDPDLLKDLKSVIENMGFFDLLENYEGVAPGVYESSDIRITVGSRSRRTRVVNHVEPDVFSQVRAQLEEFSKNELGLAALAIEPKELVDRSRESFLLGRKLYDEREVASGNLHGAIRALTEAEWYLDTIEPKPEFYGDVLTLRADCQKELQRRYENVWFIAERAVKLRDWKEAAKQLRSVCEMIPDRSDDRNRNAYKKLVDVERRLLTEK
jgi:hypothetical protein